MRFYEERIFSRSENFHLFSCFCWVCLFARLNFVWYFCRRSSFSPTERSVCPCTVSEKASASAQWLFHCASFLFHEIEEHDGTQTQKAYHMFVAHANNSKKHKTSIHSKDMRRRHVFRTWNTSKIYKALSFQTYKMIFFVSFYKLNYKLTWFARSSEVLQKLPSIQFCKCNLKTALRGEWNYTFLSLTHFSSTQHRGYFASA